MSHSWIVGDACVAIYSGDGAGYPAVITSINEDESGSKYAVVAFLEYGDEETVWLDDLLPPEGQKGSEGDGIDSNNNTEKKTEALNGSGGGSSPNSSGSSNGGNLTLHPGNVSPSDEDDQRNLTLGAPDSDYTPSIKDLPMSNGGILKLSKEINEKMDIIDSLSSTKNTLEGVQEIKEVLEAKYRDLQRKYDEQCIKLSSLVDEKKILKEEVEKTRRVYSSENVELKSRLKGLMELQARTKKEKESLEGQIANLSQNVNKLDCAADETVKSYQERIQHLESELHEARICLKEAGVNNTSGGSDNAKNNNNNNTMNTTISLDRDDSVTDLPSPMRGNIVPMEDRFVGNLLSQGPIQMGGIHLYPVLCYLPPPMDGPSSRIIPNNLPGSSQSVEPHYFSSPRETKPRQLRRPLASTEFSSRYPRSEGRLGSIAQEQGGSSLLVKEIEDPETPVARVTEIFEELKNALAPVATDQWGSQVIISLLLASPYAIAYELIQGIWEVFSSVMETPSGITVLLSTLKRVSPAHNSFLSTTIQKSLIHYGLLSLMLLPGGHELLISVMERFKPSYILDAVNEYANKLAFDEHGGKVLAKALVLYPIGLLGPSLELVLSHANEIEQESQVALLIFESFLAARIADKSDEIKSPSSDPLISTLMKSLSPSFRMVLDKFLA